MAIDTLNNAGSSIESHDPEGDAPSRVIVNGIRVPAGDVDLYCRKEGPLDVTRYVEGEFVSPWNGVEYSEAFQTLTPDEQESPDTIQIDVRDRVSGEYSTEFRGVVTGVGSSATGGSSWFQFRAQGVGMRLNEIPASESFGGNNSAEYVLEYVTDILSSKTTFDVDYELAPDVQLQPDDSDDNEESESNPAAGLPGEGQANPNEDAEASYSRSVSYTVSTSRTFNYGSDTLEDVVTWIAEKLNLYIWIEPREDGVTLVAKRNPPTTQHYAHYLESGNTKIINNDALSELKPANTLVVKAPAKKSVKAVHKFQENERGETLVAAKARHKGLYRRAGGRELHVETNQLSDSMAKKEVENESTERLKKAIDETTSGDMQTLLRAPATPYDTIEAKPVCDGQTDRNFNSLTYEVSRVHHKIKAKGIPETVLNVGVHTDPNEDIEVLDSWKSDGV